MKFWWILSFFIAIPIIVHLFSFRRVRKFYFSSIKYISQSTAKSKSKSRLKHIIILSNRILLFLSIFLLLYLIASQKSSQQDQSFSFYFDNSLSSQVFDGIDISKQLVVQLLEEKSSKGFYFDNNEKLFLDKDFSIDQLNEKYSNVSLANESINKMLVSSFNGSNYILSDYQSQDLNSIKYLTSDSSRIYHLLYLDELSRYSNVSFDTLLVSPNPDDLSKLSILVRFNVFNMEEGNLVIKLMQNNKQISSVVKGVTELDQIEFDLPVKQYGSFEVIIDGDDVTFDNSFHFMISERSKPHLMVFDNDANNYIATAFSNPDLFSINNLNINSIDYSIFSNADIVVLNDVDQIPLGIIDQNSQTNYIIFPSSTSDKTVYESLLDVKLEQRSKELLEISLEEDHPILKGIFNKSIRESVLPEVPISYTITGYFESIINYRTGDPFLLKVNNVYFFNTELSTQNGFQSKALFLPLLYQIVFKTANNIETPYYYPEDKFVVSGISLADNPLKIKSQFSEFIPEFNSNGSDITLEIPSEIESGKYVLMHSNDTLRHIAINLPKNESVMKSVSFSILEEQFKEADNIKVTKIDNAQNFLLANSGELSLWKYALFLVLLLVMSETMLHRLLK